MNRPDFDPPKTPPLANAASLATTPANEAEPLHGPSSVQPGEQPHTPSERVEERPHPLTSLVKAWIFVVAALWWIFREYVNNKGFDPSDWGILMWVFVITLVIRFGYGIFEWRYTRFIASDEEFLITRNFINHSSRKIAYDKIQGVDIAQPFAARLLRLASVHIDIGGRSGENIEYLSRTRAYALRRHLLNRAHHSHTQGETAPTLGATTGDEVESSASFLADIESHEEIVTQVTTKNLFLWSLTGSVVSLIFASASGFFLAGSFVDDPAQVMFAAIVPPAAVIARALFVNWNFTLVRSVNGLKTTKGLTSLNAGSVPRHRVQGVAIQQSILQKLLGLYSARITVLGNGIGTNLETSTSLMVAGTWDQIEVALKALWPGFSFHQLRWIGQPERARWLTPFTFSTHLWALSDDVVATAYGLFTRTLTIIPLARLQSASLEQGPLQRWLQLAKVNLHISHGPVDGTAKHLDATDAATFHAEIGRRARAARIRDTNLDVLLNERTNAEPNSPMGTICPTVEP